MVLVRWTCGTAMIVSVARKMGERGSKGSGRWNPCRYLLEEGEQGLRGMGLRKKDRQCSKLVLCVRQVLAKLSGRR